MERYRRFLFEERGLSASSVRNYADVARDFLSRLSMEGELDLAGLTTAEVTAYVLSECRRCKVASAKSMTTRLRSLLRFFYVVGLTSNDLAGAVPSVASWRLASLPKAIAPSDVVRMLRSCDRRRSIGRRDFAGHHLHLRQGRPTIAHRGGAALARRCRMNGLRQCSEDYLGMRRALGYKLVGEAHLLAGFVAFAEEAGAAAVTTDLAVAWT